MIFLKECSVSNNELKALGDEWERTSLEYTQQQNW